MAEQKELFEQQETEAGALREIEMSIKVSSTVDETGQTVVNIDTGGSDQIPALMGELIAEIVEFVQGDDLSAEKAVAVSPAHRLILGLNFLLENQERTEALMNEVLEDMLNMISGLTEAEEDMLTEAEEEEESDVPGQEE